MTTRSNLDELMTTLEEIREKDCPDVPMEVIEKIALAQYDNQDDRTAARTETMTIISDYLQKTIDAKK